MTWAVAMLCAGLGTRLRPLTTLEPKPLVPVGDRPLVDHAVTRLLSAGAKELAFNTFYLPERVQRYVELAARPDALLRCVVESELLGTAGGVRGLYGGQEHVIVWNGDIFAPDLDVVSLLSFGRQECPVLVVAPTTADVRALKGHQADAATSRGTVGLDASGRVVRLRGQTFAGEQCGSEQRGADYIGIGVFPRAFIAALPRRGCLVGDGLMPWLARGKPVATIEHTGHWSDGGTLSQYLAQNRHWLARRAVAGENCSFVGAGAWFAPSVSLEESVLGPGGRIEGSGPIRRCVVWPGARVTAPLADAVVLTDGTIVRAGVDSVGAGGGE